GGEGLGDRLPLSSVDTPLHGQDQSIVIDLPPMSTVILKCTRKYPPRKAKKAEKTEQSEKLSK
ncbi:MAG: hypothetical protein RR226_05090, partial [Oscillospiraceae bacterium]